MDNLHKINRVISDLRDLWVSSDVISMVEKQLSYTIGWMQKREDMEMFSKMRAIDEVGILNKVKSIASTIFSRAPIVNEVEKKITSPIIKINREQEKNDTIPTPFKEEEVKKINISKVKLRINNPIKSSKKENVIKMAKSIPIERMNNVIRKSYTKKPLQSSWKPASFSKMQDSNIKEKKNVLNLSSGKDIKVVVGVSKPKDLIGIKKSINPNKLAVVNKMSKSIKPPKIKIKWKDKKEQIFNEKNKWLSKKVRNRMKLWQKNKLIKE